MAHLPWSLLHRRAFAVCLPAAANNRVPMVSECILQLLVPERLLLDEEPSEQHEEVPTSPEHNTNSASSGLRGEQV